MAQLVKQSLSTPEIQGSNPDIGKISSTNCSIKKMKIKKKRPGMADLFTQFCQHLWLTVDGLIGEFLNKSGSKSEMLENLTGEQIS